MKIHGESPFRHSDDDAHTIIHDGDIEVHAQSILYGSRKVDRNFRKDEKYRNTVEGPLKDVV